MAPGEVRIASCTASSSSHASCSCERDLLSERTRDGLRAARARGRTGGRRSKLKPEHVRLARQMRDELDDDGRRRHTVQDIADELDVSRGTIYRALTSAPQPR